ncbi:protein synthesis inhibitor I-like [Aegilops tauschii subsp. strangulata]|uniref:protein synthesis inhibitor I n=1 Tax=Aegilops tauschii subsp. strangulata TaxID=200361 RepID=UPI00098A671A|nr:protein synthesis inhibitor I [Aegilops tauschii subsp. strangulata]
MDWEEAATLQVEAVAAAAVDLSPVEAVAAAEEVEADTSVNRSIVNNQRLTPIAKLLITLVGVVIAFQPASAIKIPESINGVPLIGMEADLEDYARLAREGRRVAKMRSPFTMSREGLPVLENQTGVAKPPPAWLYNKIVNGHDQVVFLIRSDNLYIGGYINPQGIIHSFAEYSSMLPGSISLGIGGSYRDLVGRRSNLANLDLGKRAMKRALKILSRYKHGVSDFFQMTTSLARYSVVLCEAQRFTEIHESLLDKWNSRTGYYIQRPKELLVSWASLSCGVLEKWKPTLKYGKTYYYETLWNYDNVRFKLRTSKTGAPYLLRLLIKGKRCQDSIMGWGHRP